MHQKFALPTTGCMICNTQINQVCNLDVALNSNNGPQTSQITAAHLLPTNHSILLLTPAFQLAIQENDIVEIMAINELYTQTLKSNLEFILYDLSDSRTTRQIVMNLLNSHVTTSTPLPTSPPNDRVPALPVSPPSASFKLPKLVTDNWSRISFDFYPWLSSVLNRFTLTRYDNPAKLVLTL